jgi:copper chaperone CopZ
VKLPITAEVKGIGICCDRCAKDVKNTLAKVEGVGEVTCYVDKQLVTFKARDLKASDAGREALNKAGFGGQFTDDSPQKTFMDVSYAVVVKGEHNEFALKNVHVCCAGCEKAIKAAAKGASNDVDVTFEGTGSQKTVRFKGNKLDVGAIEGSVRKAGYNGELKLKGN